MSKFELDDFVTPPDPDLICCICRNVLSTPLESPCQHVFCRDCITTWLNVHRSCPSCRKHLSESRLKPVLPIVRNMINRLLMKCRNVSRGCVKGVKLEMFERHGKECDFGLVGCLNTGCIRNILRKDMLKHEKECAYRLVKCKKGCGLPVTASTMHLHSCVKELKNCMKVMEQTFNKRLKDMENKMVKCEENLLKRVGSVEEGLLDESYHTDVQLNALRGELQRDGFLRRSTSRSPDRSRSTSRSHSRSRSYSSDHSYRNSHSRSHSRSHSLSHSLSHSDSESSSSSFSSDHSRRDSPVFDSPEWEDTGYDGLLTRQRDQSPDEFDEASWHEDYSPEWDGTESPNAEFSPAEEEDSPQSTPSNQISVPSSSRGGQLTLNDGQPAQAAGESSRSTNQQQAREDSDDTSSGSSSTDNSETSSVGPSQVNPTDAAGSLYGIQVSYTDTEDEDWQPEAHTSSSGTSSSETSAEEIKDDGHDLSGNEHPSSPELASDGRNTRTSTRKRMQVGDSESQAADRPSTSTQSGNQEETAGERESQNTGPTTRGQRRHRNRDSGVSEEEDAGGRRCKKKAKRK